MFKKMENEWIERTTLASSWVHSALVSFTSASYVVVYGSGLTDHSGKGQKRYVTFSLRVWHSLTVKRIFPIY